MAKDNHSDSLLLNFLDHFFHLYRTITFNDVIVAMEQLHAEGVLKMRSFWILIGFIVVAPLSSCQSLDALKYTSSLSITFILFLAIMVVLFAFPSYTRLDPCIDYRINGFCRGKEELLHLDNSSLRALSVFVFGYTCQQVG